MFDDGPVAGEPAPPKYARYADIAATPAIAPVNDRAAVFGLSR